MAEKILAINGGTPALTENAPDALFAWPIITEEDEAAALDVIRGNKYSNNDITLKFQEEFAQWIGTDYAVCYPNGTMSITAAMFACGLGKGDEIICPTKTYWASVSQAFSFGATPVFCNINEMLSVDPADIERCITPKTKAIIIVHYFGYPCDMDAILPIVKKHNLLLIEDVSHAQGGLYKGKKLGTFGDIAAMSLMSTKSFSAGELGIVVTSNKKLYERAVAYGHYEKNNKNYITESDELKPYFNIALGGVKGRANQLCTAIARVQLKYYDERCAEIRRAMNYFWDLLEDVPGIVPIRVDESTGSNMAGWYCPHGGYRPEELGGLSVDRFCEAVRAEIPFPTYPGGNFCLHTHEYFRTFDLFNEGTPSRIVNSDRDVRTDDELCRPSERICCFSIPWFKQLDKEWIEKYAAGFRKVAENYRELLDIEKENDVESGRWFGFENEKK